MEKESDRPKNVKKNTINDGKVLQQPEVLQKEINGGFQCQYKEGLNLEFNKDGTQTPLFKFNRSGGKLLEFKGF